MALAAAAIPFGVRHAHDLAAPPLTTPGASASPETDLVPDSWTRFTAPDGSFQVLGPDQARTARIQSSLGPAHVATFEEGSMTVSWTDGGVAGAAQDASLLQGEVTRVIQPVLGTIADEEEQLTDLGHPGFGLAFTVQGTEYRLRIFAAGGRLYEIVAQAPAGSEDARQAQRFVDSFTLR